MGSFLIPSCHWHALPLKDRMASNTRWTYPLTCTRQDIPATIEPDGVWKVAEEDKPYQTLRTLVCVFKGSSQPDHSKPHGCSETPLVQILHAVNSKFSRHISRAQICGTQHWKVIRGSTVIDLKTAIMLPFWFFPKLSQKTSLQCFRSQCLVGRVITYLRLPWFATMN